MSAVPLAQAPTDAFVERAEAIAFTDDGSILAVGIANEEALMPPGVSDRWFAAALERQAATRCAAGWTARRASDSARAHALACTRG